MEDEEYYAWRTYNVHGDTLVVQEAFGFKLYFRIQSLTRDSVTLLPITDESRVPNSLKLIKRELRYELIDFDSIVYSEKNPPIYLTPAIEIISKVKKDGRANYFRHETDTVKQLGLNRRRIMFSDKDGRNINSSGLISAKLLSELRTLLNDSNIKNINISQDFESYLFDEHGSTPSTLEIYKNGLVTYRITTVSYPMTLAPVVSFMIDLADKIK